MAIGQGAAGGALGDPTASQTNDEVTQPNGGAIMMGIACGSKVVLDDNPKMPGGSPLGIPDATVIALERIGTGSENAHDVAKTADVRFRKAPAQIADGAQEGATGWYNHTGVTVEAGQWYFQVQAA